MVFSGLKYDLISFNMCLKGSSKYITIALSQEFNDLFVYVWIAASRTQEIRSVYASARTYTNKSLSSCDNLKYRWQLRYIWQKYIILLLIWTYWKSCICIKNTFIHFFLNLHFPLKIVCVFALAYKSSCLHSCKKMDQQIVAGPPHVSDSGIVWHLGRISCLGHTAVKLLVDHCLGPMAGICIQLFPYSLFTTRHWGWTNG